MDESRPGIGALTGWAVSDAGVDMALAARNIINPGNPKPKCAHCGGGDPFSRGTSVLAVFRVVVKLPPVNNPGDTECP